MSLCNGWLTVRVMLFALLVAGVQGGVPMDDSRAHAASATTTLWGSYGGDRLSATDADVSTTRRYLSEGDNDYQPSEPTETPVPCTQYRFDVELDVKARLDLARGLDLSYITDFIATSTGLSADAIELKRSIRLLDIPGRRVRPNTCTWFQNRHYFRVKLTAVSADEAAMASFVDLARSSRLADGILAGEQVCGVEITELGDYICAPVPAPCSEYSLELELDVKAKFWADLTYVADFIATSTGLSADAIELKRSIRLLDFFGRRVRPNTCTWFQNRHYFQLKLSVISADEVAMAALLDLVQTSRLADEILAGSEVCGVESMAPSSRGPCEGNDEDADDDYLTGYPFHIW